jgi:hypothetical protein
MALRIKRKILEDFLKKSVMTGTQSLREGTLNFQDDGLHIDANNQASMARVVAWLKKEAFEEYEAIGKVGLNELPNIVNVVKRFGEELTLIKEGNLLTVKSAGKKVDVELMAENLLATDAAAPSLEFADTFSIPGGKLQDVFSDVGMNKDASLIIETHEKKVCFKNTGKYKFETTVEALSAKGGERSKFGEPFIQATQELKGDLELSLGTDYPIKVRENTESSVISIIVAPLSDTE